VALALAYGQEGARVAVVEPALRQTIEGVDALTGGARLETVDPACPPQPERGGVLICGPGPFCAAGNPMRVLSVEGLGRLRKHLGGDGVLALWFPAGNVEWETLRRGLATFSRIFPKFDVWLAGSEAVFVASGGDRMAFRRMETLFGDPAGGHWLRRGGFWEPIEMLVAFTARSEELSGLWEETPVYRLSRPVRPPTLARDLLAQVRPENLAVLAQHKLAGPARVADRLLFTSDNRREVALRGLAAVYRGNTEQILRALGRSGERGRSTLVEFVTGPYARLDFLAPDRQGRAARVAGALTAFGLTGRAIDILEEAVQSGEDTFEARMQLVEALTRARRPQDGLQHCRRALELRPASVSAMRRLAALLMGTGRIREGADALAKVVEQNPRSVVDLLMLAELRARMGSLEEAADLARRALELDPDNTDAQVLLQLTRRAGDDRPRRPGTGGAR
jgi:tetratricopeptide (TPR) repeat protein